MDFIFFLLYLLSYLKLRVRVSVMLHVMITNITKHDKYVIHVIEWLSYNSFSIVVLFPCLNSMSTQSSIMEFFFSELLLVFYY